MLNVPIRLTRMTRSNASSFIGPSRPTTRPAVPMPAQLTSTRAGPCAARAAAIAASAEAASATSQRIADPADRRRVRFRRRVVDVEQCDLAAARRQ